MHEVEDLWARAMDTCDLIFHQSCFPGAPTWALNYGHIDNDIEIKESGCFRKSWGHRLRQSI